MLVNYKQDEEARHHFNGKAAFYAGLCVGLVFLAVNRGNPWDSFGVPTLVMGRPLYPSGVIPNYGAIILLQLIVSICYAFIVSAVIYRLKMRFAIPLAAIVGAVLYALNFLLFHVAFTNAADGNETVVALIHIAFCMIAGAAYKGFAVPKPQEPAEAKSQVR